LSSARSGATCLAVVFDLHAYRARLPTAGLRFEPWPGRVRSHVAGYRFVAGENRTPRMPERVIAPVLAWSLKYVTLFAPDILALFATASSGSRSGKQRLLPQMRLSAGQASRSPTCPARGLSR
jgi:hypothetical protein